MTASLLKFNSDKNLSIIPEKMISALRNREDVYDFEFDQVLPPRYRDCSDVQWTTIRAAQAFVSLIGENQKASFVDLGSGVGKMCLLLALLTDLEITGVERRESLVKVARNLAETNAPGRIHYLKMDMFELEWRDYDLLYMYNPFFELVCRTGLLIDSNIQGGDLAFRKSINSVYKKLDQLLPGQRVVTFHGFGGKFPANFKLIQRVVVGKGSLGLWERSSS